jgi:hypothetical protein
VWQYGYMPSRKLTFTLPRDLERLSSCAGFLPASGSQYVATAIADKRRDREKQLVRACEAVNNSSDVREIESSFEALADESGAVQEPW